MTVHHRAERRDANEPAIVDALRGAGALVERLSAPGLPDLLVAYRGRVFVIEVKTVDGDVTPAQQRRIDQGWPVAVVSSPLAALMAIAAVARRDVIRGQAVPIPDHVKTDRGGLEH